MKTKTTEIKSFKGFDKNMKCRGFQFKEGKTYKEEKAIACQIGFHACENPIDCLSYYTPSDSVYHEVLQKGEISKNSDDSKVASTEIKIGAKIDIKGLIKATLEYVKSKCTNENIGADFSALTGGNRSALVGGDRSALTGGDSSALTGGYRSALVGGYSSALVGGDSSVIYGCGIDAKVRAGLHSVLALAVFDGNYNIVKVIAKVVDGKKILADTWYILVDGKFTKTE
jgi:hypothetical protein